MKRLMFLVGMASALAAPLAPAMNNYDDPRILLTYKDAGVAPALDILRVTAEVSEDGEQLVFQVMTRGGEASASDQYVLEIDHGERYRFVAPVQGASEHAVMYKHSGAGEDDYRKDPASDPGATVKRISRGVEFSLPMDWVNFGAMFEYDVYTIGAGVTGEQLAIDTVHDRASKGRKLPKRFPAITMLNRLCASRSR